MSAFLSITVMRCSTCVVTISSNSITVNTITVVPRMLEQSEFNANWMPQRGAMMRRINMRTPRFSYYRPRMVELV